MVLKQSETIKDERGEGVINEDKRLGVTTEQLYQIQHWSPNNGLIVEILEDLQKHHTAFFSDFLEERHT